MLVCVSRDGGQPLDPGRLPLGDLGLDALLLGVGEEGTPRASIWAVS